jgi:threonine/homoserine/homoserine lactone efflux protein
MDISFFLKGLIIGFSIAAPVGPIGVLCIQRTLVQGRVFGLVSGLGAATADGIYGLIAGFGLTVISNFLIGQQFWLRLVGGLFLCYLGVKTLTSKAYETSAKAQGKNLLSAYSSVFLLTLTNPMTILSFAAIFVGLGVADHQNNSVTAFILVLGVFLGSALWWLILSSCVSFFKHRISKKSLTTINRFSGVIILMFAAMSLYVLL